MNIFAILESSLLIDTSLLSDNILFALWSAFEWKMLQLFSVHSFKFLFDWWDLARLAKMWKIPNKSYYSNEIEVWNFSKILIQFDMLFSARCHEYWLNFRDICELLTNKVIVNILKSLDNFKRSISIQRPQVHKNFGEISQEVLMKIPGTNFIPR